MTYKSQISSIGYENDVIIACLIAQRLCSLVGIRVQHKYSPYLGITLSAMWDDAKLQALFLRLVKLDAPKAGLSTAGPRLT